MEFLINSEGATTKQNIDFEAVLKFLQKNQSIPNFGKAGVPTQDLFSRRILKVCVICE